MSDSGTHIAPGHVCTLVVVLEGEAVCFECAAYYIYAATMDPIELAEMKAEAEKLGRV